MRLPGPGSIYLTLSLKFLRPVRAGDLVTARVAVIEIVKEKNLVTLQTTCADQTGERLIEGTALVMPPRESRPDIEDAWLAPDASRPRPASKPRLAILIEQPPDKHGFLVGQRMTPNPVTVSPDATLSEARAVLDQHGIRPLPVVRREALVGMITEADLREASLPAARETEDPRTQASPALIRVRDVMSRDVVTIGPTAGIGETSTLLVTRKVGALPVVEDGRLVGVFTVIDALEALVGLVGG